MVTAVEGTQRQLLRFKPSENKLTEIAASTGKTAIADALTGDAVAVVVAVLQARAYEFIRHWRATIE